MILAMGGTGPVYGVKAPVTVAAPRVDRTGGLPLPDGFGARGAVVIRT